MRSCLVFAFSFFFVSSVTAAEDEESRRKLER